MLPRTTHKEKKGGQERRSQKETTCDVRDFITSFAALDFKDSSVANAIASWVFCVDF